MSTWLFGSMASSILGRILARGTLDPVVLVQGPCTLEYREGHHSIPPLRPTMGCRAPHCPVSGSALCIQLHPYQALFKGISLLLFLPTHTGRAEP